MAIVSGRWEDLFAFTSDAIYILDKDWRIVALNPKAESLSGWNQEEVSGNRVCTDLFICHSLEGQELCDKGCPKQAVFEDRKSGEPIEVKLVHKNGSLNRLSGRGLFLPSTGGKKEAGSPYAAILVHDEEDRRKLQEVLLEKERRDPLTGLFHRQYFEELYGIELKRAIRHGGAVALLMLDVRDLSGINSRHGDPAGDKVLKEIGRLLQKNVREVDIMGRFGGDEFVILLYGADDSKAKVFIRRLKQSLDKLNHSGTLPREVHLDYSLEVADRDYDRLLGRVAETIEKGQGKLL
ncbi:MAG: diguanylate cyclase [Nitrospirae bacterium]|nr:diguanylate cyclase [Nitrospirota bacterium]